MCIVPPLDRLASASVVLFGRHGEVSRHARSRGLCRQALYRQADSVLRDLDDTPRRHQLDQLRQQIAVLHADQRQLRARLSRSVEVTADLRARFAATAQAEGVSLPAARSLLAALLGSACPSVAQLGRDSRRAALRAGPLLRVLDELARPRVRRAAADEIFFGRKPVLMVVEPESQCWLSGRLSPSRDGEQWAEELQPLTHLEHLVRDGGKGLANGLARVNAGRPEQKQPVTDQLDHFHTLREGRRALRKTQAQAERAWAAAEAADKRQARRARQGKSQSGYATRAALAWREAEDAFRRWEREESALAQIRAALRPFTPEGELNTRLRAEQAVAALLPELSGEHWGKFKRAVGCPESYAYLDRLGRQVEALPVEPEVRDAVVLGEGIRQNPQLVAGEGPGPARMRGVLIVLGVLIASAGEKGRQAVEALRQALSSPGRSSSCVEGLNSVVRMQQSRHRKVSQELLDLKRLYWNLRVFRTGRRKDTSPYGRLGVPLPQEFSWWQLLQLTPEQLRARLSAQQEAA